MTSEANAVGRNDEQQAGSAAVPGSPPGETDLAQGLARGPLTRKRFLAVLAGAGLMSGGLGLGGVSGRSGGVAYASEPGGQLPEVGPVPEGAVSRDMFAPVDQTAAPFLKTLAALANSVEDEDPETYGWITGDWWRAGVEAPFNARTMENLLTLGYFYSVDRPWNVYRADDALRQRFEAAVNHWMSIQHPDGYFHEYDPNDVGRAATGFAIDFVSLLTQVLPGGPGINPELYQHFLAALRRAVDWFLDPENETVWGVGVGFSNQVAVGMEGVSHLHQVFNDPSLTDLFHERLGFLEQNAQSPAGYFYERNGPDHSYNASTMSTALANLYRFSGRPEALRMEQRFLEWFGYNAMREPDGSGFITYIAIATRSSGRRDRDAFRVQGDTPVRISSGDAWVRWIPTSVFGAWSATWDEVAESRALWATGSWEDVQVLGRNQVNPGALRRVLEPDSFVTEEQRQRAIAELPYMASDLFTEYRSDPTFSDEYLYIRRPHYYAGMAFGPADRHKRFGLGFVWHPRMGMLLHSQNRSDDVWGTFKGDVIDAKMPLNATYRRGRVVDPRELGRSSFTVEYGPPDGSVSKQVKVLPNGLKVRVSTDGEFVEQVPLIVMPSDELIWLGTATQAHGLVLGRGDDQLVIEWGTDLPVEFTETSTTYFSDEARRLHLLRILARDELTYRVQLA